MRRLIRNACFHSVAVLGLGVLGAGCFGDALDGPSPDAGTPPDCQLDSECGVDELCVSGDCVACDVALELPPPSDPCLPKCGNEKGVGMPCTRDGGECNGNDIRALFCSVDQVPDADLALCTGPCGSDEDCGSNAICSGDPSNPGGQRGCIPAACGEAPEGEGE